MRNKAAKRMFFGVVVLICGVLWLFDCKFEQGNRVLEQKLQLCKAVMPLVQTKNAAGPSSFWVRGYPNLQALYEEADEVVAGVVTDDSQKLQQNAAMIALAPVHIVYAFKNTLQEGTAVMVAETGFPGGDGTFTGVDGVPLLCAEERVLLFLHRNIDGTYRILNDYVGKFWISPEGEVIYAGALSAQHTVMLNDFSDPVQLGAFVDRLAAFKP